MGYEIIANIDGTAKGSIDDKGVENFTRVFRVIFDYIEPDAKLVCTLPELPKQFDPYPGGLSRAVAKKVSAAQEKDDPTHWLVTFEYSTVVADKEQIKESPLDKPPKVSWNGNEYQQPFIRDVNGNLVTNSAGDPPTQATMVDDARTTVKVVYNVAVVPTWIIDYKMVINDADFTIEGIEIPEGCARIKKPEVSETQVENDIPYRQITLNIEIKDKYTASNVSIGNKLDENNVASHSEVEGWQILQEDVGYQYVKVNGTVKTKEKIYVNGSSPSSPQYLDGKGGVLTITKIGDEVYRRYDCYTKKDFSVLNIPE